ncbi:MAG: YdcF family protein [Butyricimonas faecihominis]
MKQIVLTLGAPNDEQGNLSPMAVDRLECALGLYLYNDDVKILCTGGFGESFNTTNHPHAYYSKRFLIERGVRESDFLEFALTTNTVEDFRMSKPIIEREIRLLVSLLLLIFTWAGEITMVYFNILRGLSHNQVYQERAP